MCGFLQRQYQEQKGISGHDTRNSGLSFKFLKSQCTGHFSFSAYIQNYLCVCIMHEQCAGVHAKKKGWGGRKKMLFWQNEK